MIKTTISSHSLCFICRVSSKKNRLHKVMNESITKAYYTYKILIKKDARCCKKHLDIHGFIKDEEFNTIQTKIESSNHNTFNQINEILINQGNVFDKFRNVNTLDENLCKKITGWSKKEFLDFSEYITSINNSSKRSKYELIAIYKYWLRKGLDQLSLSMFKNETSQQQISHYLEQIRNAINKDFVPYFIGINRPRSFFLKHNNSTVVELHNLQKDDLAIVVDATYTRLEKSSNNNFQYNCWSQQKMDLLKKPFLICCADGYIIDCYGPFPANKNDSSIFEYILNTDKKLVDLLGKNKTVAFLDRGFRDIVHKLINKYQIIPKIPTCQQLEEIDEETIKKGQLTQKQANESRFVTKCRFIIEKQNGSLKNFKSLDNIRNTVVGHIQIDYRIACAFLNFNHKPCCPDGKNSIKIARKLKEKCHKAKNELEFLLTKKLDSKKIEKKTLCDITDFPKLSKKKIIQNIIFGTYQYRQCKSYIDDLVSIGSAFLVSTNIYKKNIDVKYKIIAFEIPSRHKRTVKLNDKNDYQKTKSKFKTNYKLFIQFKPNINKTKAIISYICSCKSGRRSAGCCSHIAAVIFYLSYAKYRYIKIPAEHLNSVLVNMNIKELPNQPRYVKNKRNKKVLSEESSLSESSSECESEFDNNQMLNVMENQKTDILSKKVLNKQTDIKKRNTRSKRVLYKECSESESSSECEILLNNNQKCKKKTLIKMKKKGESPIEEDNSSVNKQIKNKKEKQDSDIQCIYNIYPKSNSLVPIPDSAPHDYSKPINLSLTNEQLLDGEFLTDYEIYAYLRLLKAQFPHVNGLESTSFLANKNNYIVNKTRDFVRILHCNNDHWICVSGSKNEDTEDILLFDSLPRTTINEYLGEQMSRMVPESVKEKPYINIRIQKTQKQQKSLCGYFSCAYATALCEKVDIETIIFEEKSLITHFISCIEKKEASMFPNLTTSSKKNKEKIIFYKRK